MSLLQDAALLHTSDSRKAPQRPSGLRPRASIAALIDLVRDPVGNVGELVKGLYDGLTKEDREEREHVATRKQVLYLQMRNATEYEDWKVAAVELDELEDSNSWKHTVESEEYCPEEIQNRLNQLDAARINCDAKRMLFLVRTALTRNLGNMGNLRLYKHSHIGTKDLIERYIESALENLRVLVDVAEKSTVRGLGTKDMLDEVLLARQSFGRSALLLSGGATFGMCHSGVLKALWENKLLPRIISGASAGSIVCSVLCCRTDDEVPELLETFCHGDLAVFEEEGNEDTLLKKLERFLKHGSLFDISHLTRVMKELLGDMTFQEAYNRTRRILNICVSSASLYELPRLLNFVTAPNVLIWSAVAASCSVPFVFSSAELLAKDKLGNTAPWNPSPQKWIDGSVDNDLPMTRLAEMFNVNHFIVSQVNPHVVPFLAKEESMGTPEMQDPAHSLSSSPSWLHTLTSLAKSEALFRMNMLIELGIFPNTLGKTVSILSQKYSGDITILPEISYADFPRMLSNPSVVFMENAMLSGERATWPKFSRIRNHLAIELALDDAVQKLLQLVVFSGSEADLRLTSYAKSRVCPRKRGGGAERTYGGGRQRKMSQASDPNAFIANAAVNGRFDHLKDRSHQKSRSLHVPSIYGGEPPFQPSSPEYASQFPTSTTSPIPNLTSSEAETSNIYTSDSYADQSSSSIESPNSPSSPVEPDWPDQHQLFTSYSTPTTPAAHHRRNSSFLNFTNSKLLSPQTTEKPLSNTPVAGASKASTQETKYKKLFHSGRARFKSPEPASKPQVQQQPSSGPDDPSSRRFNALGLKVDLSGTRAMMMRKKRPE